MQMRHSKLEKAVPTTMGRMSGLYVSSNSCRIV
jgi:hypothetical protein